MFNYSHSPTIFVLIRWSNFYFYNRCQLQEDEGEEGEEDEGEEDEEDGGEEDGEEGEEEEGEGDEAAAASKDWDVWSFGSSKRKDELATFFCQF